MSLNNTNSPACFASEQPGEDPAHICAAQRDEDDIRQILDSPHGVRFIRRLLGQGRLYQSSFSPDGLSMAFQEGQRNQALALLAMITTAAPHRIAELLTHEPE